MKSNTGKVTRFMDMHSGGKLKTPFTHIYVDAPLDEALEIFKDTFKRDPNNVTCKCCGEDFVYEEHSSLEEATAYDRECRWVGKYDRECGWVGKKYDSKSAELSLEEYFSGKNKVIFITE
jgi:hypothetical protein